MVRRPGQVSLERAISKLGIASRGVAREWILAGRVRVSGIVRRLPSYPVNPDKARIEVDGQGVEAARKRVFILNKPRGVITTRSDEKGRSTVFSLLETEPGLCLHAVGRLDAATTGLLILTNDTRLSSWLTDPGNEVPRVYLVSVRGEVSEAGLASLVSGVRVEGEWLRAHRAEVRKASGKESHLVLELRQGKNREIRRLLEALGHEVTRLKRVSFAGLELGELAPGESRELSPEEVRRLSAAFRAEAGAWVSGEDGDG